MTLSDDRKWVTFQTGVSYNHSATELLVFCSGGVSFRSSPVAPEGAAKEMGVFIDWGAGMTHVTNASDDKQLCEQVSSLTHVC